MYKRQDANKMEDLHESLSFRIFNLYNLLDWELRSITTDSTICLTFHNIGIFSKLINSFNLFIHSLVCDPRSSMCCLN